MARREKSAKREYRVKYRTRKRYVEIQEERADAAFVRDVYDAGNSDLRALADEYRAEIPPDAPGYAFSGEFWARYYALFQRKIQDEENRPGVVPWRLPVLPAPKLAPRPAYDDEEQSEDER